MTLLRLELLVGVRFVVYDDIIRLVVIVQIVVHGSRTKYHKIFNRTQYVNVLSPLAAGSKVTIQVRRGRRKMTFRKIRLGSER